MISWQIPAIISAFITLTFCYLLHNWDVDRIEAKQVEALKAQVIADNKQCNDNKKITSEVSTDYEDSLSKLSIKLTSRLFDSPTCIVPVTKPTIGSNGKTKSTNTSGQTGLRTVFIRSLAAEGDKYRLQVTGLQSFIDKTWKANNQ